MIELKPETEQLLHQEMQRGPFHSLDDLIVQGMLALRHAHPAESTPAPPRAPRQNLADLLLESPFAGSELPIERQRDFDRSIILD